MRSPADWLKSPLLGRMAELLDLLGGGLGWIPWRAIQGHKGPHMPCRPAMILDRVNR